MFFIPIEQFSLSQGRYHRREGAAMLGPTHEQGFIFVVPHLFGGET